MRRTEALASVKFYQILSIFIFFIRLIILEDFIRLISYNGPCVRLGCSFFLATALKSKKNDPSEPDLSGTQIKRWVVNLSIYKLNQDQTSVLSKGLNFGITPHRIPTNDIIVSNEVTQLITEIVGAINSSKTPKSNISKAEKRPFGH